MAGTDLVDFWVCDAVCLPFGDDTYALAASLNLLDCVQSPYDHLKEMARVLLPEAGALIATPYDWNPNATPVEAWLGGHSQRSPHHGASEAMLHSLLAEGKHPQAVRTLEVVSELGAVPWHLRLHDRSSVRYQSHMTVVRKKSA
jgi:ubiquinone/menaquinone biosynthesis C-methylase UbiE